MAVSTITGYSIVSAGNLDDTAVVLVDDKLAVTHKATIAQLRTQLNTGAQVFTGNASFAATVTVSAAGPTFSSDAGATNVATYAEWRNNSAAGDLLVGVESTASSTIAGSSANGGIIATLGAKQLHLGANSQVGLTIKTDKTAVFAAGVGFNNQAALARPTISGSRGANVALASLLTALANYGLIADSTT